ncbi:hypothetical protein DITRI_Ditri03aG0131700 [Diplodiscus trichospermus]
MKSGLRRRIGNGQDTFVWRDPWLLDEHNPYLETACVSELEAVKVSSLLHSHGRGWDEDLVPDLFIERDAALVLSIPLSHRDSDDVWFWYWDKKRQYTVRSGYRSLTSTMQINSRLRCRKLWKFIWALKYLQRLNYLYGGLP